MKRILYILTNRRGKIVTVSLPINGRKSDSKLLTEHDPASAKRPVREILAKYVKLGYALSNWHIIAGTTPVQPITVMNHTA